VVSGEWLETFERRSDTVYSCILCASVKPRPVVACLKRGRTLFPMFCGDQRGHLIVKAFSVGLRLEDQSRTDPPFNHPTVPSPFDLTNGCSGYKKCPRIFHQQFRQPVTIQPGEKLGLRDLYQLFGHLLLSDKRQHKNQRRPDERGNAPQKGVFIFSGCHVLRDKYVFVWKKVDAVGCGVQHPPIGQCLTPHRNLTQTRHYISDCHGQFVQSRIWSGGIESLPAVRTAFAVRLHPEITFGTQNQRHFAHRSTNKPDT
jgi:hypothetical protein